MKRATFLAAVILAVIAAAHLLRLVFHVPVSVGTRAIPMWASPLAAVVFAALVFAMWRENRTAPPG